MHGSADRSEKGVGTGDYTHGVSEIVEVVQEVDAVPVLTCEAQGQRGALIRSVAPATQAMVVAASGFVAGAAVVGLASRRRGKRKLAPAKGRRGARRKGGGGQRSELVQILGTRSLLVDVHLLGGAER